MVVPPKRARFFGKRHVGALFDRRAPEESQLYRSLAVNAENRFLVEDFYIVPVWPRRVPIDLGIAAYAPVELAVCMTDTLLHLESKPDCARLFRDVHAVARVGSR